MSIASLHTVRIVPIARDPALPIGTPALLARWLGAYNVACDGSGGIASITLNMGGVGEIYGAHALWDLKVITVEMDSAPATVTVITLSVNSYETEGAVTMSYSWFPGLNTGTYYQGATSNIPPDFKFRTSDVPGFPSNIRLVGVNTFGQKYYLYASGYIYDERMI